MLSSSRNASSTRRVRKQPIYSCKRPGCNSLHIANPIANIIIRDVSNVKQKVICNQCGTQWIVCTICEKRFASTNTKLKIAENHFKNVHPGMLPTDTLQDFNEDSFESSPSDHEHRQSIVCNTSVAGDVSQSNMSDASKHYFTHDISEEGFGLQALIGRAVTGNAYGHSYPKESMYHLNVAKFCEGLNQGQVVQFGDIMKQTADASTFKSTRAPHSLQDINQWYIKGQTSIFQSLPSPTIHTTDAHAYVSLISVIDHFLAFGFSPDYITPIDDVSQMHGIATCAHAQVI